MMQELSISLKAVRAYALTALRRDLEPHYRYFSPIFGGSRTDWEQFATLTGAKPALSIAIGNGGRMSQDLVEEVLQQYSSQLPLAAYFLYVVISRGWTPGVSIGIDRFGRAWKTVCLALSKAYVDPNSDRTLVSDAAIDLCAACWSIVGRTRGQLFSALVRTCTTAFGDDRFYRWMMFLACTVGESIRLDAEALEGVLRAVRGARTELEERLKKRAAKLPTVEALMRLRQLEQTVEGLPVKEHAWSRRRWTVEGSRSLRTGKIRFGRGY